MDKRKIGEVVLDVRNVTLRIGVADVLTDISFDVREREIRAITGPQGAGKSSLLNVINGAYRFPQGPLALRGEVKLARPGVARTFQTVSLFKGLSVMDNLMMGRAPQMKANICQQALGWGPARREEREHRRGLAEIMEFLQIGHIRDMPVNGLPLGLQKRVELGRAMAAHAPILLLDEPMAGLNLQERGDMCRYVVEINKHYGTTLMWVENDIDLALATSHRLVVLDHGRKVGDGTPDEVRVDPAVIAAYSRLRHEPH